MTPFKRVRIGEYYRIQNGSIVGPIEKDGDGFKGRLWRSDGMIWCDQFGIYKQGYMPWMDLVERMDRDDFAVYFASLTDKGFFDMKNLEFMFNGEVPKEVVEKLLDRETDTAVIREAIKDLASSFRLRLIR